MQIAPSTLRDDFLQPFLKWVFMYHHFYETFPRVRVILQHPQRMEGIFNTISHAIYVCGMHEVKLNGAKNLHHVNAIF